jgi:ribosomal protein S24E
MSDAVVIKTRKFKRNPLLSRRQVRRSVYRRRRAVVGLSRMVAELMTRFDEDGVLGR